MIRAAAASADPLALYGEEAAFDVYRKLLPDWKLEGIDCRELGRRAGGLHCAVMNMYRVVGPFTSRDGGRQ